MAFESHPNNLLGLKSMRDYDFLTVMTVITWEVCEECLATWG